MLCEWAGAVINRETGKLIEYHHFRKKKSTGMHEEYRSEMKFNALPKEWKTASKAQTQCPSLKKKRYLNIYSEK